MPVSNYVFYTGSNVEIFEYVEDYKNSAVSGWGGGGGGMRGSRPMIKDKGPSLIKCKY
jgi:hypothetical protein